MSVLPQGVLVTRPDPEGSILCQRLEDAGIPAFHLQTISFASAPHPDEFAQAIECLGEQDWLIFISPQAVYASLPAIQQRWRAFPETVKIAAIGAGSAQALEKAGYQVDIYPSANWNSEGLLNLPVFKNIKDQHVAIIRGLGGRELLDHMLAERGAHVLPVIAYERLLPQVDMTPYLALLRDARLFAIICASFEGVKNLKSLFGPSVWPTLKQIDLIVVSERIKILAQDLGFQTIWVAQNASPDAILELLAQRRKIT